MNPDDLQVLDVETHVTQSCETTSMTDDDRDRLISEFADSEYRLARELASVRQLLHITLGQSHEQGRQLDRLREQHRRLRDEYRSLRKTIPHNNQKAAA